MRVEGSPNGLLNSLGLRGELEADTNLPRGVFDPKFKVEKSQEKTENEKARKKVKKKVRDHPI